MKRYDYYTARSLVTITGIVWSTQLMFVLSGLVVRKPGLWWIDYALFVAFVASLVYGAVLIYLNSKNSPKS